MERFGPRVDSDGPLEAVGALKKTKKQIKESITMIENLEGRMNKLGLHFVLLIIFFLPLVPELFSYLRN